MLPSEHRHSMYRGLPQHWLVLTPPLRPTQSVWHCILHEPAPLSHGVESPACGMAVADVAAGAVEIPVC